MSTAKEELHTVAEASGWTNYGQGDIAIYRKGDHKVQVLYSQSGAINHAELYIKDNPDTCTCYNTNGKRERVAGWLTVL